jgi:TonB family protein
VTSYLVRRASLALAIGLAASVLAPRASALTVDRIGSTVRRHVTDVRVCYLHALRLRPDLAGRVVVRFTVDPAGAVSSARVESDSVGDPTMSACMLDAVRHWRFPAGTESETVSYPFVLSR